MAKRKSARDRIHELAVALPGAYDDYPWGERVVKVGKKIFVFLGIDGASEPGFTVKLRESHEHAMSVPGAAPASHGLGKAGWVTVPLSRDTPSVDVLCDWVEESYRLVAPKRLVAELDARSP
jgi:predicted DNA-binding protein (MmcQ/YjbR family)